MSEDWKPTAQVGDKVTMKNWPVRRRWWQFWKPKVSYVDQQFTVEAVYMGSPNVEGMDVRIS